MITTDLGYHSTPYHMMAYHALAANGALGAQVQAGQQFAVGAQVYAIVNTEGGFGAEVQTSHFGHRVCQEMGYHTDPYHMGPYHQGRFCAGLGAQVQSVKQVGFGCQVRISIYNTNNFRILCHFPSRGDGTNWTASSTEPSTTSSFDILNVNTDIVEQYWRSATGIKTGIQLDCDAGAGQQIFLDTLAFLNHNLTSSAIVSITGSNNAGHAPSGETISLVIDSESAAKGNFVYIAPSLPLSGWRYWRILIDDATQPMDHIRIGTIVFGSATVFNNECFVDRVRKAEVNYKDTILTEAFSSAANDRGIKRKVTLNFRNIKYLGGNWERLEEHFQEARTVLKCLYVPTPAFPLRYMTFAKLTRIPEEEHNVKGEFHDFVNFVIDTDEAL